MTENRCILAALAVAILVDIIQIPEFLAVIATSGTAEVVVVATDIIAAIAIINLIGWHWALLPSLFAELIPGVNLVPTWTVAVLVATRELHHPKLESK